MLRIRRDAKITLIYPHRILKHPTSLTTLLVLGLIIFNALGGLLRLNLDWFSPLGSSRLTKSRAEGMSGPGSIQGAVRLLLLLMRTVKHTSTLSGDVLPVYLVHGINVGGKKKSGHFSKAFVILSSRVSLVFQPPAATRLFRCTYSRPAPLFLSSLPLAWVGFSSFTNYYVHT